MKFCSVLSLFGCKQQYLYVLADMLYEKYMLGINIGFISFRSHSTECLGLGW
jgi:hypothetical protein